MVVGVVVEGEVEMGEADGVLVSRKGESGAERSEDSEEGEEERDAER